MSPDNVIKANELLLLSKHVNEKLGRIKFSISDDDYDIGIKDGQRMALQEIHDVIMGQLGKLLKGV